MRKTLVFVEDGFRLSAIGFRYRVEFPNSGRLNTSRSRDRYLARSGLCKINSQNNVAPAKAAAFAAVAAEA